MKKSERIPQLEKQVAELQREIAIIKGTKEVSYQSPFKTPHWNAPYEYPKIQDKKFWMRCQYLKELLYHT